MSIFKRIYRAVINVLKRGRDVTISLVIKLTANHFIKEYGKMLKFSINSVNNDIILELMLKGEKEPVIVKLLDYSIEKGEEKAYFHFEKLETSREWMNILIQNYLPKVLEDNSVEIPAEYANMLKIIM